MLNMVKIETCDSILEVGCGSGHNAYSIAKYTPRTVIGIDSSQRAVSRVQGLWCGRVQAQAAR